MTESIDARLENAVRKAMPEFRLQDDYLLAHGASLMSENSHEIIHIDTLRKIIAALRTELSAAQAEPVANDDVDLLLRAVFEVCEATEDAPEVQPKNEHQRGFDLGRRFEAKNIRKAIGVWFQDTFCGRSFMGEPVLYTTPPSPSIGGEVTDAEITSALRTMYGTTSEKLTEEMAMRRTLEQFAKSRAATPTKPDAKDAELEVWYGKMPESCGRTNWTARLIGNGADYTINRSEYPHRVRYAADCVRHIIGELAEKPFILDYNGDECTPCHVCGGTGEKDGRPCHGLNFKGTVHAAIASTKPAEKHVGTIGHVAPEGFGPMTTALAATKPSESKP